MNGSLASIKSLLQTLLQNRERFKQTEVSVLPPFVYLELVQQYLQGSPITWGAQNVSSESKGAYTGEISVPMLQDFHCRYVTIGHSERRQLFGETDQQIAAKLVATLCGGLHPILCIGETAVEREAGQTLAVVSRQLAEAIKLVDNVTNLTKIVIAYEPVWAIGTGRQAAPAEVQEVHQAIRAQLNQRQPQLGDSIRIIYGGSVKPEGAAQLFIQADIDGALVGGASLLADQFIEIAEQCKR